MPKAINYNKLILFIILIFIYYENDNDIYKIKILKIRKLFNKYNSLFQKDNNITALFSYYRSLINKYSNENDTDYKTNPLISIIIPLYNNKNEYILRLLMSIEEQTFKNIEIIYIDDFSENNSKFFLNILKILDKRILLIKNEKNRGILYSKCLGVKISRGKYVIVIDQDDMLLSKNLLNILYKNSERYKLDILQFQSSYLSEMDEKVELRPEKTFPKYDSIITQPKLGEIENFLNNSLGFTFTLWDKIIKRNIYIKAINFIGKDLFNSKIIQREDHIIIFPLYKIAERYMRINVDGYLKILHNAQASKFINPQKSSLVYDEFTFLFFLYNNTHETEKEKQIFFREFLLIINILNVCVKVNNNQTKLLIFKICNFSLNSEFINNFKNDILI